MIEALGILGLVLVGSGLMVATGVLAYRLARDSGPEYERDATPLAVLAMFFFPVLFVLLVALWIARRPERLERARQRRRTELAAMEKELLDG